MFKKVIIALTIIIFIFSGVLIFLIVKQTKGSDNTQDNIFSSNVEKETKGKVLREEFPKELLNDKDQDGLSAEEEASLGTSDLESDSDGDGLSDYVEVKELFTNPTKLDTDDDGIPDYVEVLQGTDPNKK